MWSVIKCEIGWKYLKTIRQGWCVRNSEDPNLSAWIENGCLAIWDDRSYYPGGCYDIPLDIIEELKRKNNE